MTKSKAVKSPQCNPADHMFTHVEVSPSAFSGYNQQIGGLLQYQSQPTRIFKLYCCKCGEVRAL